MIARFVRPTVAVVLAAALGVLALTGCGSNARSTTTSDQAYPQTLHYLQETADHFPAGTRLSRTVPGGHTQGLSPGAAPGGMDDDNPEQPYCYYIAMWVLLPGASESAPLGTQAFNILVNTWHSQRYSLDKRGSDSVVATTPDGYLIQAQVSSVGDFLSVEVISPYFPKSQLNRDLPWPSEVTPAGGH